MATASRTWVFAAGTEGLADVGDSAITVTWDATPQMLEFTGGGASLSERGRGAVSAGNDWTALLPGLPSGATVTDVQCTAYNYQRFNTVSLDQHRVRIRIVDSAGASVHSAGELVDQTISNGAGGGATDASKVAGTVLASRAVDSAKQAAATLVALEVQINHTNGAASNDLDFDDIAITVTYTTAGGGPQPRIGGGPATFIPGLPSLSPLLATGVEQNALGYVTPLPISRFLNPLSLTLGAMLFPAAQPLPPAPVTSVTVSPSIGNLILAGDAPAPLLAPAPTIGNLVLLGIAPVTILSVPPSIGNLILSASAPTAQVAPAPTIGNLILSGISPTLASALTPTSGNLLLSGNVQVVQLSVAQVVGLLQLLGNSPNIADRSINAAVANLILSGGANTTSGGTGPADVQSDPNYFLLIHP